MSELLGCPWCGEQPQVSKHLKYDMWRLIHNCEVMGSFEGHWTHIKDMLVKRWNSRAATTGVERIAVERRRQMVDEGWDDAHDDQHGRGEIAWAAACYAAPEKIYRMFEDDIKRELRDPWPWDDGWDKRDKHSYERRLEIAGALIAAELDRLARLKLRIDEMKCQCELERSGENEP